VNIKEKLKQPEKNLKYFHAEAAALAAEDAGAAYQAPSLIAAGADAQHVSLLSAMLNLPVALMYFRLPSLMKKIGSRKKCIVIMALLDAFTWLPLIAAMYFLRPAAPFLLIALWVFNLLPGVLPLPMRDSWLADTIPLKAIGRHLGIRAAISAAVYLGIFYLMGYILDVFNEEIFTGFVLVSGIALIATLVKAKSTVDYRMTITLLSKLISASLNFSRRQGKRAWEDSSCTFPCLTLPFLFAVLFLRFT